jgi:hypothetical protein
MSSKRAPLGARENKENACVLTQAAAAASAAPSTTSKDKFTIAFGKKSRIPAKRGLGSSSVKQADDATAASRIAELQEALRCSQSKLQQQILQHARALSAARPDGDTVSVSAASERSAASARDEASAEQLRTLVRKLEAAGLNAVSLKPLSSADAAGLQAELQQHTDERIAELTAALEKHAAAAKEQLVTVQAVTQQLRNLPF